MRLDHIAYRTFDRTRTAKFFIDALGYKIQQEFSITFDDGTTAQCVALEPPEKLNHAKSPWVHMAALPAGFINGQKDNPINYYQEFHMPPEIFVSDGPPGSIVGEWVKSKGGIGGIHHIAYQVASVEATMKEWKEKGYAEFSSDEALKCPGLVQVFTRPSALTGIIYEFIERGEHGFCVDNVRSLIETTKGL